MKTQWFKLNIFWLFSLKNYPKLSFFSFLTYYIILKRFTNQNSKKNFPKISFQPHNKKHTILSYTQSFSQQLTIKNKQSHVNKWPTGVILILSGWEFFVSNLLKNCISEKKWDFREYFFFKDYVLRRQTSTVEWQDCLRQDKKKR